MCGLARSGKSTWIKKNKGNAIIICPDVVRKLIFGHQFHSNAEDFIWACTFSMVKILLDQGKDIIVDATNLNFDTRNKWYRIAKSFNAKVKIVLVPTSLEQCKINNSNSPEDERLPEKVLEGMDMIFEDPRELEMKSDFFKGYVNELVIYRPRFRKKK